MEGELATVLVVDGDTALVASKQASKHACTYVQLWLQLYVLTDQPALCVSK